MTSFTLAPSTSVGSATDAHGNPMSGDADTIERYDRAIDRLIRYHPEAIDLATELAGQDAPAPMAHALIVYLHLMSTDPADLATARDAYEALAATDGNAREQAHAAAIGAWQGGDWTAAARRLDELLIRWPGDLLALMLGHQLDFFLGDAQNLRDRPIRSLRELADHPHATFVQGMAAFGLEESGHYGQALDAGLAAVEANADDVWAIHAVAHTYEMQGRVDDGIAFMTLGPHQVGVGQPVHGPQLVAPRDLSPRGRTARAVTGDLRRRDPPRRLARRPDRDARRQRAAVADAAGRNRHRWSVRPTRRCLGPEGGGRAVVRVQRPARHDGADRRRADGRGARRGQPARPLARRRVGTNARMTAEIGLPACRAVVAFAEDRHADVIADLMPIRRTLPALRGSHAQRDALQRTLLESALRSGRFELARALTAERLGVRETSVYGWTQRARALHGLGDTTGSASARQRAATYRTRFSSVS